ncbi:MAG: heat shock protein transcriptional repressor HspR [Candidatus Aminicenantia bacterium]
MRNGKQSKKGEKKKYFMISAVSKLYNIHPQTLRLYEREGLLRPSRTEGNTRIYTEEDLKRLEIILNLSRDLGVNLAGIEIILNMREKMEQMQREVKEFLEYIKRDFFEGREAEFERRKSHIVKASSSTIARIFHEDKTEDSES